MNYIIAAEENQNMPEDADIGVHIYLWKFEINLIVLATLHAHRVRRVTRCVC